MKRIVVIGLSAVAAMVAGACSSAAGNSAGSDELGQTTGEPRGAASALVIDEITATRISGDLRAADGQLSFSVVTSEAGQLGVTLLVNGKAFVAKLDDIGTSIDGHGAVLTPADRNLFRTFIDQFEARFAGASLLARDASLNRLALYLSLAPDGYAHDLVTSLVSPEPEALAFGAEAAAVGDEGVTCIKKGTTVTATYTNRYGTVRNEAIVVGSKMYSSSGSGDYSCMGKCGAGCRDYWFMKTGYTKDCLDHDACSRYYNASGGSSHPDCGDEYKQASGDFTNSSRCTGY